MTSLYLSDIMRRAGIDPKRVKLIRHALSSKGFRDCYEAGMVKEYTQLQRKDFAKGYDIWMVFISDHGTNARFTGCYKVIGCVTNNVKAIPHAYPHPEDFDGIGSYFEIEEMEELSDMKDRLIVDWGKSARKWDQNGTTEKAVVAIQANPKKIFSGYENLILTYSELKEIVDDSVLYDSWHIALASVYAIYLITDTRNGEQYVGSAYGKDGLLGRWSCYVRTKHGNDKRIIEKICKYPERYKDFQFSILQILPKNITDDEVINIETLWKNKLMSKKFGMNVN